MVSIVHRLFALLLPTSCVFCMLICICLRSRRLHTTLAAASVLFAHAVTTCSMRKKHTRHSFLAGMVLRLLTVHQLCLCVAFAQMAQVRAAIAATIPSIPESTPIECTIAQLLLSSDVACLTTEVSGVYTACGNKDSGFVEPTFSRQQALTALAEFQLPEVLKPRPKM